MIETEFRVRCDDCDLYAGVGPQPTAKDARKVARKLAGYIYRDHPDIRKKIDLCPTCAKDSRYHQQSTMNVQKQLDLFDAEIDRYPKNSVGQNYWIYLKDLFILDLDSRPKPFTDYKPMFDEEFGP